MNQLVYLILIFIVAFLLSLFFMINKNRGPIVKLILIIIFSLIFSYACYLYNYFIFNEYVILDILYSVYIAYIVKIRVNKRLNKRIKCKDK